jgi:hypothetical protein
MKTGVNRKGDWDEKGEDQGGAEEAGDAVARVSRDYE